MRPLRLILVLFFATNLQPLHAGTTLDAIRERGVLRIGTTGDYAPFSLHDPASGALTGFDIEQGKSLAASLGVRAEFVTTSWPTLSADLSSGRFDIAMSGVSITADRAAKGMFSTPYLHDGKTPIARCADAGRYDTIEQIDRPEVRVVVNPGGTNERFARAHFPAARIAVVPDNRAVFDEIAAGRADVMVTDAIETKLQARKHPGVLCAVHPDRPFESADKAYWFAKDEAFSSAVDAWLAASGGDGSLARRQSDWLP